MVRNNAAAVAAEISRMAEQSELDDATVAEGIKLFIADSVLAAEASGGQVSATVIIDQLSGSLKQLVGNRRRIGSSSTGVC